MPAFYFKRMEEKITTLIFDVNETLLDLEPLHRNIDAILGEGSAAIWFAELLQYSLVESITGTYHDFSEIGAAVLDMNARKKQVDLSQDKIEEILAVINRLDPYPEVRDGLRRLKAAGFTMVALSNGKPKVLKKQLDHAALSQFFNHILSVEAVRKYKPHPETYAFAAKRAGSATEHTMMVAAHGWDIAGAQRARMQTAFIERPAKFIFPLAGTPTLKVNNIAELAECLSFGGQ